MIRDDLSIKNITDSGALLTAATEGTNKTETEHSFNHIVNQKATKHFDLSEGYTLEEENFRPDVEPAEKGNFMTPKIFVAIISLVYGLYDVCALAFMYYQKDQLNLNPQFIQLVGGLISFPFVLKPVFGYLCDGIIAKTRRVKYIILVSSVIRMIDFIKCKNRWEFNIHKCLDNSCNPLIVPFF